MSLSSTFWRFLLMASVVPVGVSATTAVSLSNFVPRIENLPQRCQSVYTATIQGCQESDFTTDEGCSQACVNGLFTISREVTRLCGNVNVPSDSIIGVFLNGAGIQSLCPNVVVTTSSSSSTSRSQQPPRTMSSEDEEATRPAQTTAAASESSSSSRIQVDPGVPTEVDTTLATSITNTPARSETPPANTAQPQSSSVTSGGAQPTADSQKSNDESGGGSPFDVVASGGASQMQHLGKFAISWMIGTAALFTFLL